MSKHTPGPWRQFAVVIEGDMDEYYRSIRTESCNCRGKGGFDITGFISEADARLIAAAPELLDACQSLVDAKTESELNYAAVIAAAAIAYAKGELSK
jgi:hypothetical protein